VAAQFRLASCAAVLVLSHPALAAEDALQQPQLILLHQPAPRTVQTSPEKAWATLLASQRIDASRLYAQFFADHQLTEVQIDELTNLIAEHSTLTGDWWTSGEVHFAPDHERARQVLSQVEQFLGPAGFREFEAYRDTLPERYQLNRLVSLLTAVGHPLTSEQTSQLVSIMRAERGDQLQAAPNSDELDRRIEPRFAAVLSVEQREFAERYFAGRAERRHAPGPARSPD